jgi:lipid A 4'-phosphatase
MTFFYPNVDLYISSIFYDSGFVDNLFTKFIYKLIPIITIIVSIFIIFGIFKPRFGITKYGYIFLLITIILGPGVAVNGLKDSMGRARPMQTKEFGGEKSFSKPLILSDQCNKNCSFVCGHASVGFWLISFAFLYSNRRIFYYAVGFGSIVGIVRIAQGGHYFSDVIFSFVVVYIVVYGVYILMRKKFNLGEKL